MPAAIAAAKELLALVDRAGLSKHSDPLAKAAALELCFRSAFLLGAERLAPVRDQYPATQQALMASPEPAIVGVRDALIDEADFFATRDLLDLLSEIDSPCIAPRLHRGWRDRVRSCQEARRVSHDVTGFAVTSSEREQLLTGLGICHRVFRVPPPFDIEPTELEQAFGPLSTLIAKLAPEAEREAFSSLTTGLV